MSNNLNIWIEGTIMAALATVLSFIPFQIGPSFSITVGAPVMVLYCLRRGFVPGVVASFLWGVLHILVGTADILTPFQGFLEYFVAFGFTGFAGLWAKPTREAIENHDSKRAILLITVASVVGTVARYFWHTIAGYYFWGQYAPEGMNAWIYSLLMNGASAFSTGLFTIIILVIISQSTSRLFLPEQKKLGY